MVSRRRGNPRWSNSGALTGPAHGKGRRERRTSYYYLANAEITHPAVLTTGLVVLWAVWVALLVDTLIARGAKRMHRAVANVAPVCVVIGVALYFLV
ncbi:hypothetical protein [Microbacterium algeriense]|uniref:hypothetical protein n=1 Tax=Microbacterium algeriense TaxID=2615184 RepID=UPI0022E5589A|nr:hypothetical protein [Microbacterium algeriense]